MEKNGKSSIGFSAFLIVVMIVVFLSLFIFVNNNQTLNKNKKLPVPVATTSPKNEPTLEDAERFTYPYEVSNPQYECKELVKVSENHYQVNCYLVKYTYSYKGSVYEIGPNDNGYYIGKYQEVDSVCSGSEKKWWGYAYKSVPCKVKALVWADSKGMDVGLKAIKTKATRITIDLEPDPDFGFREIYKTR